MRKIKVVVLLVQQLQHGFTKNAKVSPNLTVAHICWYFSSCSNVIVSILLSILVCAAASLLCANVVSVQVFVPYVIAGNTHELYNCLFRQVARFPCLAYAAELVVILRRISLSRFTSLRLYVAPGIHILPYFLPENRIC